MTRPGRRLLVALVAVTAFASTACGSRLTSDERGSVLALSERTTELRAETARVQVPGASVPSGGGSSVPAAASNSTATKEAAATGATGCPPGDSEQPGLTDDSMTIATIADVSGVQPGIFQGAHEGARAAAAYINSRGGICGRRIETLLLDDKTDAGGNRAAMLDACDRAFVVVGSMSAFDDGGAAPGQTCGIPDMTAISTTLAKVKTTNTYPMYPSSPAATPTTNARYIAKRYPNAVKKAALIYINIAVGKAAAEARQAAWEKEGFEFVYVRPANLVEPNYTPFVVEMQRLGVEYVHLIGDFQNMVRLQKTMRQQGWLPQVRDFDSITYDPGYLLTPEYVDGSLTFINFAPFEEAGSNTEMKLFLDWLARTSPGVAPDSFSLYAWSGYRLFQRIATTLGGNITRKAVLDVLAKTETWDGGGLHGPQRIGERLPTTCVMYLRASGERFKREHPASGFDCNGGIARR